MSERLDVLIFGATGFTGNIVVEYAFETLQGLKWGIAGRNQKKLARLLLELGEKLDCDTSEIPIVLADVNDKKSIEQMAKKCKVVINCCGPYYFYGEVVVRACIEAGTHHVDVSGEPAYVDNMQLKFNELAQDKNAYVISTCGVEAIMPEMGVLYAQRHFDGIINSIEVFMEHDIEYKDKKNRALLHHGTWDSAVYAMKYAMEMYRLQRHFEKDYPKLKPKLCIKPWIQRTKFSKKYFIPFPATDRDVVKRSQSLMFQCENKRPIQFETYFGLSSLLLTILLPFAAILIAIMAQFRPTRKILLGFPHIFTMGIISRAGPSNDNMNDLLSTMTFLAKGWAKGQEPKGKPKQQMLLRLTSQNSLYGLTSFGVLCCAKVILQQADKMPGSGGVLPPGMAFAKTSLMDELTKHKFGIKYEIISNKD